MYVFCPCTCSVRVVNRCDTLALRCTTIKSIKTRQTKHKINTYSKTSTTGAVGLGWAKTFSALCKRTSLAGCSNEVSATFIVTVNAQPVMHPRSAACGEFGIFNKEDEEGAEAEEADVRD